MEVYGGGIGLATVHSASSLVLFFLVLLQIIVSSRRRYIFGGGRGRGDVSFLCLESRATMARVAVVMDGCERV